jgi:hypothetical protein
MNIEIIDGILIGAVGGSFAGLALYLVQQLQIAIIYCVEAQRIYKWLGSHTTMEPGKNYRSTRTIASHNNVTEDRVRYICSTDKRMYLSTGKQENLWGIHVEGAPRIDGLL